MINSLNEYVARRIVLFTTGFGGGGAEHVFVSLANYWQAQGHDVRFWVVNDVGPMRKRLHPDISVRALGQGFRGLQRITGPRRLRQMVFEDCPDIIFSTLSYANCMMGAACRNKPPLTRLVLREANSFANLKKSGRLQFALTLTWMRRTYPAADGIIANAADMADELSAHVLRSKGPPIAIIPNPVELEPKDSDGAVIRQAPGSVHRIIACGRLIPQKGFSDLLQAVSLLPNTVTWELVILGDGPLRTKLEAQSRALGVPDRVVFPGFVDDVRAWLRGASLFVLSSHWEGFPNVLVEAMACGVTPVATRCPGASGEILKDLPAKHLVPVGDPEALARSIEYALEEPLQPLFLKKIIERNYAFSVVADRYLAVAYG